MNAKPGHRPIRARLLPSRRSTDSGRPVAVMGFGSNVRRLSVEEAETLGCHLLRAVAEARGVKVEDVRRGLAGVELGDQDGAA